MPHHFPSAAPRPQSSTPPPRSHSELAERIARFQTTAQDLLAMYEPAGRGSGLNPRPSPDSDCETRCYYLSAGAVQHERKLLKHYGAEDFFDLLAETYMLLVGVVKIMKSTHHDVRVKGYVIASLGCLLEQASKFLRALMESRTVRQAWPARGPDHA